ncbi:GNAT family N-acetyltransferase [Maribacter aestuarii]|uniref:GNAT family N-acetyltransferase n=1 Tax=Maribacter aestuarii TaxID=1130723 RepID=UPI00248B3E0A|nr:GNAT family N-acetyltransferase [Maribacter aestuarii]
MKISPLQIHNLSTQQDYPKYKDYLKQINTANPFYRLEILLNPLVDSEGLKYFVFSTDDNPRILMLFYLRTIICPITKKKFYDVISPYSYSGPIFNKDIEPNIIIQFWKAVDLWYKENNVVSEFIRFSLNNNHMHYSGLVVQTLKNVKGQIVHYETQWSNFSKKVRNNIRKALKYELEFDILQSEIDLDSIKVFYKIYLDTMIRNNAEKRYHFSLDYFIKFLKNNGDCSALALVKKNNLVISVELLLMDDKHVYSFLGGTDATYFKFRPNDFLKFNVINWARDNEYKYYVLGGGQIDNDSLYKYKKTFFPLDENVFFHTGRKIINIEKYKSLVMNLNVEVPVSQIFDISKGFFPRYRE